MEEYAPLLRGMAIWTYDDWQANVMDAWVLRLQAPTKWPSGFYGGYYSRSPGAAAGLRQGGPRPTTASAIEGHYIHVRNGKLVAEPPYHSPLERVVVTARFLSDQPKPAKNKKPYEHLMFFAHGGLTDLASGVARAGAMAEVFKRNGIYPVVYLWRTGLGDSAMDLIAAARDKVLGRAGGTFGDINDVLIERASANIGRALWNDMKRNAALCAHDDALAATRLLVAAATARETPMQVHYVGHSAGAILLGEMFFAAANGRSPNLRSSAATVSLLAPPARWSFSGRIWPPWRKGWRTLPVLPCTICPRPPNSTTPSLISTASRCCI